MAKNLYLETTGATGPIPNAVAVLGSTPDAADIALRKVLQFRDCPGPAIVIDYTGRGAMILSRANEGGLPKRRVLWYDLADRRCPTALFQLSHSDHFRQVMTRVLLTIKEISRTSITERTLTWAAEAAYNLSKSGTVGLGALLKSFSSRQIRRWFLDTQRDPNDLGQLLGAIAWALRFPSIYAISEGINKANLQKNLKNAGLIWIEAQNEHFEKDEHMLIACLVDAVIEDTVRTVTAHAGRHDSQSPMMTVVQLFPLSKIHSELPGWVRETSKTVRHLGVHRLQPDRPLRPLLMSWASQATTVWVVGKIQNLKKSAHQDWLTDREVKQVSNLGSGQVWIRSNESRETLVARVRHTKELLDFVHTFRCDSSKRRRMMPVRQMGSAVASICDSSGGEYGLYQKLCEPEVLRMGWFKVQGTRKDSCGVDEVTVVKFKGNIENELFELARDLKQRKYRCKPLRRSYIPKPEGGKRSLGIACVRDRVVQSACLILLEPIFEPTFSHRSFAFRPHRNAHQALALVRSMIAAGRTWAVIADINRCFDSIDHSLLLRLVSHRVADHDLLELIRHWLTVDVLDFHELLPVTVGVPQGQALSPLLANIYLTPLDNRLEETGLDFVRYADDIMILTKGEEEAQKALRYMEDFLLDPLHLQLKPAKTNYVPLEKGFDFLGFTFDLQGVAVRQERIDGVEQVLRIHIKALGQTDCSLQQQADSIMRVNAVIRGFRNYFAISDIHRIEEQMRLLDDCIEQIADFYLPTWIRNDPAWVGRERFWIPKTRESLEGERSGVRNRAQSGCDYPEMNEQALPAQWMIKDTPTRDSDETNKKSAVDLKKSNTQGDSKNGNSDGSIVLHGDRLYVLAHGSYLTAVDAELVIKKRKVEVFRCPFDEISLVFLQGYGLSVSVNLQVKLAELDIALVLTPPVGDQIAILNPITSSRSFLRSLQVLRRDDPDVVSAGINMIASKAGNQAAVLRYFAKYRKKVRPKLSEQMIKASEDVRGLADNIRLLDPATASVRALAMGFEGQAAAIYWRQLMAMLPEELGFNGRITKSAKDPVNQSLNYVYGILYGEVWHTIAKAGLDPYFGLIHGSKRDQGSLVFDLIEEFRAPFADRLVIGMLGRGFQPKIGDDGFLKAKTRKMLAISFSKRWSKEISWRSRRLSPAAILQGQANSLAKLFSGEGHYHAYKMRW